MWSQVQCDPKKDQESYTGYQVELWRDVARLAPWLGPDSYFFDCLEWGAMIADLVSPNGTCFAAPAGVDVTIINIKAGLQFSWVSW